MNNKLFKDAVERAYLKLSALDDAEFKALLSRNIDGEYAKIVRETNFPGIGIYDENLSGFEIDYHPINFDTCVQSSFESIEYANILYDNTNCFIVGTIPITAGWVLSGTQKIARADNYDIQDQDYLWAKAA